MLLDAHCHLQEAGDLARPILAAAGRREVGGFFCNAVSPRDWAALESLSVDWETVTPFIGVHPWHADQAGADLDGALAKSLGGLRGGVGEIGLDKARPGMPRDLQAWIFSRQLEVAARLGKPVTIHCVRAWGDMLAILRAAGARRPRLLFHSFRGSGEILEDVLRLGAYVSFSWKTLCRGSEDSLSVLRKVPPDRLLLETDFPYAEPGPLTAERYFQCLEQTYEEAARERSLGIGELRESVWENGKAFLYGTSDR
jgi:TatD DNase family protein